MLTPYFFIIVAAVIGSLLVQTVAALLNLRAMATPLPPSLEGIYNDGTWVKSRDYLKTRTRFGIVVGILRLGVLLAFWFAGGFGRLDLFVRGLGFGPLVTGLVFLGGLYFTVSILSLPVSIYSTFVIEERYGFNRTSRATFAADRLKGLLLGTILGGILLTGLLWFFGSFPRHGWLFAWGGITLFGLGLQFLAPAFILPLFNTFTPLPDGELREAITDLARRTRFPLGGVFVIDGSRRSSKANAFFTGFGRTRRIALFDTLIEEHDTGELTAILAHEIGHWKRGHILKGLLLSTMETGIYLWLLSQFLFSSELASAFAVDRPSVHTALVFFGLLYAPVSLVLSVIQNAWSRRNEFEADRFAVERTGDHRPLVRALKRLAAKNLSNLTPHPLMVLLEYSHPPLDRRIRAMERVLPSSRSGTGPEAP